MKKTIGKSLALYPTPLVVVGAMIDKKPNYLLVGHLGIMGHDHVMISLASNHYTNRSIKENRALTINLVDRSMLKKADYVGSVSGYKIDKSNVFQYHIGITRTPIIDESPVVMECTVDDIYETSGFENYICKITAVHAEDNILNETGKLDYSLLKPVLFEMPTYQYLLTGNVIGQCLKLEK